MSLLVNHHSLEGALQAMDSLLKSLKYHLFMHVAADNSIRAVGAKKLLEEQMDSCNFGVSCLYILYPGIERCGRDN